MEHIYRHGDIPFYPLKGKVEGEIVRHNGSFVLAEGETTGHKHLLTCPRMEIRKVAGGYILALVEEAQISHEDHKTIKLPAGNYFVGKEREVDHFVGAVRKVLD